MHGGTGRPASDTRNDGRHPHGAVLAATPAVLASPAMASVKRARFGPLWVLLAGSACVMASSGCLWNDSVNELPRVAITGPPRVHVGEKATFMASLPGKSGATFEWGRNRTCPASAEDAGRVGERLGSAPSVTVTINADAPDQEKTSYCVFVIGRDSLGAQGFQKHEVMLVDRRIVITVPSPLVSGVETELTASFSDDPTLAAQTKFYWGSSAKVMPGNPEAACEEAGRVADENRVAQTTQTAPRFKYKPPRTQGCVVAMATDNFKVDYVGSQKVTNIMNGGPPASPRQASPKEMIVGIFSHVRLAAAEMGELNPGDVLDFKWTVKRPDGTDVPHVNCPGVLPTGSEICFDVGGAGEYPVELVTTEAGQTGKGTLKLTVEDRPPCIRMADPKVADGAGFSTVVSLDGEDRVLKIEQVVDDGDPLPPVGRASEGVFVWTIRSLPPEGSTVAPPDFQLLPFAIFSSYTLPASQYRLGDRLEVRVEYRDRLDIKNLKAREESLSHCNPNDLSCPIKPGSDCFLRVGWKVLYL
jgi:hypothetical protein